VIAQHYAEMLERAGFPEREVARGYFFVDRYGLDAVSPGDDACVTFAKPTCGDWDCLNPEHQRLERS
jgi:hypothetical protein